MLTLSDISVIPSTTTTIDFITANNSNNISTTKSYYNNKINKMKTIQHFKNNKLILDKNILIKICCLLVYLIITNSYNI